MDVKQVEDAENICGVLIVFVKALSNSHAISAHILQFVSLQMSAEPVENQQRPSLLQEKAFVVLSQADSNHHKHNQKLLCYHYTIGQSWVQR